MKDLKKIISAILMVAIVATICSCGSNKKLSEEESARIDDINLENNIKGKKLAVVYFSVDDQAEMVAEEFATELDADLYEIEPEVPYKDTDVDFDNPNSRVSIEDEISLFGEEEEEDETYALAYMIEPPTKSEVSREIPKELPKINKINVGKANIIIVGFPSWNNNAPKPVYTFLKDLKDKIIIPFCTDGEFGKIDEYINNFVDNSCTVMTGRELSENTTIEEIRSWMAMLSAEFDK